MAARQPNKDEAAMISRARGRVVGAVRAYKKDNKTTTIPTSPYPDAISSAYESYVAVCGGIRIAENEPDTTVTVTTEQLSSIISNT